MAATRRLLAHLRGWLVAGLFLVGFCHIASAFEYTSDIPMENGSGVSIRLNTPYRSSPETGFVPVHVRIVNERKERLAWTFTFQSGGMGQGVQNKFAETVSVGPMQTRETYLLVPRAGLENKGHYDSLRGIVEGPAVKAGGFGLPTISHRGGIQTGFVVMSQSLAGSSWSKLEAQLKSSTSQVGPSNLLASTRVLPSRASGRDLRGTPVDLQELPADERALSGAGLLFLTAEDWTALPPPNRTSIGKWIHDGGRLCVVVGKEDRPALAGLDLPAGAGNTIPLGFGTVEFLKLHNGELPIPEAAAAVIALDNAPMPAWQVDYSPGVWTLPSWVGWPRLNVGLIVAFVCIFGLVIGPVNLRWFAPHDKRHRMFFTVPALSALASVVLIGVIVVDDGVGGIGARNVILALNTGENRLTILQEQVSRARLLLGRDFKLDSRTQFGFITPEERGNQARDLGRAGGGELQGDWFRSRAVQMHYLRSSIPSRAEVTLASGGDGATAPTLLSSVPGSLREVFFKDAREGYWYAKELPTGRPITLTASTRKAYDESLERLNEPMSRNFQVVLKDVAHRPGHFYALAERSADWPMATLSSIDWQREMIFAFGPCTVKEVK